jgi:hypothetical protein
MFAQARLFPLIISVFMVLCFCTFLSAQEKFFSLNEKWYLELESHIMDIGITAIKLYDINANGSLEILIGAGLSRYPGAYGYGILHVASDSARDIIATSAELPYGISCVDVGDLGQNGTPEIHVGTWYGDWGQLFIFSAAELDTFVSVPETTIAAVVSIKIASLEESTVVYLATSENWSFWDLGCIYAGTGYLYDLRQIEECSYAVPQQIEFADVDVEEHHELIWGDFYWFWMTSVHGTSAHICIRSELPDDTVGYVTTLFDFHGFYWGTDEGGFTSLEIGNCDADSSLEILGGAFVDTCGPGQDSCHVIILSAVDGSTKVEQWRAAYFDSTNIISGIALVDFNHDGMNEVLVVHQNAPMELLNGEDGSKIAESDSSYTVGQFAFGDVDGDGEGEIVIAEGNILRVLEPDFSTDVPGEADDLALRSLVMLGQNYPNPFNSSTTITFTVKRPMHINLSIYNILGQRVRTLLDEEKTAGNYRVRWDGKNEQGQIVPSGIYFCRLTAGKHSESKKILFLK